MSDLALRVEGLGKRYLIGEQQERYQTFRDTLNKTLTAPIKRAASLLRGEAYGAAGLEQEIWALRNVSFEVKHGDVVGIIGNNGAGKSTLLKVLSRITEPTEGYVDIYGRIGALLEVGTGFHPELTGRENTYLNGAILGMVRSEIDRKFDEIVDFSGVEKFIDTPIKHYSSGMQLRLGFAVAAHLEPDILVIDEVLAVGDIEFQKKCINKMGEVSKQGRTVLFVSHNMAAVSNLCNWSIILDQGQVLDTGPTNDIIQKYVYRSAGSNSTSLKNRTDRKGNGLFRWVDFKIVNGDGAIVSALVPGQSAWFELTYEAPEPFPLERVEVSLSISDMLDQRLFTLYNGFSGDSFQGSSQCGIFRCRLDHLPLTSGTYKIELWAGNANTHIDWLTGVAQIDVLDANYYGTGKMPKGGFHGPFLLPHSWKHIPGPITATTE